MKMNDIDIADTVEHIPSGEEWIIARVDGIHVWPCGWPESRAMLKDCILIEKATEDERSRLIHDLKRLPESDPRCFFRHEQDNKV